MDEEWISEVVDAGKAFAEYPAAWAIAGGWALDLFLNRPTRTHADIDIIVWRADQATLRLALAAWSFAVADAGVLRPWAIGEWLTPPVHEIHATSAGSSTIELLLNERDESHWIYRRDHGIRRNLNATICWRGSIPYLAPEIVLLYKSKAPRPADEADFANVAPALSSPQREWLHQAIARANGRHRWLSMLSHAPLRDR
jgi:aminoglycoside-2''-adenylyltransferase